MIINDADRWRRRSSAWSSPRPCVRNASSAPIGAACTALGGPRWRQDAPV